MQGLPRNRSRDSEMVGTVLAGTFWVHHSLLGYVVQFIQVYITD